MGRGHQIFEGQNGYMTEVLLAQRGALLGWVPVCLALGIGCYFSLTWEPILPLYLGLALAMVLALLRARQMSEAYAPLLIAIALCLVGFLLAGARAHSVSEPVLGWRYYGPVEGRIIAIDRSRSDVLRVTLDRVRLDKVSPARTPQRVRISLHGAEGTGITPTPGLRVMTTAHLSPPAGPVEPGGFEFQRHAFFARLGAVGYTRVPLMGAGVAAEGHGGLMIFRIRMAGSKRIRAHLPGDTGGFAAAITTGDRSAMSQDALNALRASNLAHLLAISGLHMGLLTAVVFGALRLILAAHPMTALYWPTKGVAALGALIAAAGYLALSGGNVATQRAFIMVAVALAALIIGRRALSLRAVAVAAIIVLVMRPEVLMGPGFQMSFAATTALVAVFGWLRDMERDLVPKWAKPIFGTVLSSLVAGLATAPIAAAHFNTIAHYGLIANLLSVPLMGVLVIPAAVLALVLSPFGLEWIGLWAMGLGLDWILGVAHWITAMPDARGFVVSPGPFVLPLLALGFVVLVLWQGHLRWSGVAAMALAFVLWHGAERPAVLIADTGAIVGVMTTQGPALSKPKGAGFIARNWLENDGQGGSQAAAARLWSEGAVVHLNGKRALAAYNGCDSTQLVVASADASDLVAQPCLFFDVKKLRQTGAISAYQTAQGWQITTAREVSGDRLWTNWPKTNTARD